MQHPLLTDLLAFNKRHGLFQSGDRLAVALSGGIDSVVLAHLLHQVHPNLLLLHMNFGLRGADSDADEAFVRDLAQQWQLPVMVERVDTAAYKQKHGVGTQQAARDLRYGWFSKLAEQLKPANGRLLIATAHHADDQAETLLLHLCRGTGINGLAGIPVQRDGIIRPLLFATKSMVEDYAAAQKLSWVHDASNDRDDYTRNRLRHQVMPMLADINARAVEHIAQTAERLAIIHDLLQAQVQQQLKAITITTPDGGSKLPVLALLKTRPLQDVVLFWISQYGFGAAQVPELLKLAHADNGSYMISPTHRMIRHRRWLQVVPLAAAPPATGPVVVEQDASEVQLAEGTLHFSYLQADAPELKSLDAPPSVAYLDAASLQWPLLLKRRADGDYFYPLGLPKKKKIAKLLTDQKVPLHEKERLWLLQSSDRIAWVVGLRIDHRFRVTPATTSVLRLEWKPGSAL